MDRTERISRWVDAHREALLEDLKKLCRIRSVAGEPAANAPYGEGPAEALRAAEAMCAGYGFSVQDHRGRVMTADLGEPAGRELDILAHLDVVPENDGWDSDPFEPVIREDGYIYGRGVADDKGGAVAALYAMRCVKELDLPMRAGCRLILGTDEERGSSDIADYYRHEKPAPHTFTPDAEFPVCNGEKGGFNGEIVSPAFEGGVILDFQGGVAHNVVPDRALCRVRVPVSALKPIEGVTVEADPEDAGVTLIRGWGKSGHAAMPAGTVNAIGLIVNCLLQSGVCTPEETAYLQVLRTLHAATDGSALGIAADDGLFDPLTIIGGTIEMRDGALRQSYDCRYPTNTDEAKLTAALKAVCGQAAHLENVTSRQPFYISADSPAIQTLINTYNDVTGEGASPFTMGGGTYARHFPYAVSFGPEHADQVLPDFAGPMHGANEGTPFEKLIEALKIYILALLRLQEIEL